MDATDEGVAGIVAARVGEELARVEDRHCEDGRGSDGER